MKLIVAEKPSVARDIAKIVGADKSETGFLSGNSYYVSWCVGHLVENAMPAQYGEQYKQWRIDTLPILPAIWKTNVLENTAAQFEVLKKLMHDKDVDGIICAGDCGREGELIFRLVYSQAECKKPVQRLWISSLEEQEIRRGLAELQDGSNFDNLYHAALCRSRADWLVGMNLSRLYSILCNKKFSVGRVQTPTVAIIAQRQTEIEDFIPRPYWQLVADVGGWKAYSTADTKTAAESIVQRCNHQTAYLSKLTQEQKSLSPPHLFSITVLQREANRLLGYTAQQTLTYLQCLYEKKLVTYPRTESEFLPSNMLAGLPERLQKTLALPCISDTARAGFNASAINYSPVIDDKKITDHHAIIPTGQEPVGVPDGEKNIFLLVVYRFLAALAPAHVYLKTTAILDVEGEAFKATGKAVVTPGYQAILDDLRRILKGLDEDAPEAEVDEKIPAGLQEGMVVAGDSAVFSVEKKTQPPKPYTDATLLAAMANVGAKMGDDRLKAAIKGLGLGTGATRAAVIETIIKSGYVVRSGKQLLTTESAKELLSMVDSALKQPEMTAEWESKLEQIVDGQMDSDAFMDEITHYVRILVDAIKAHHPDLKFTSPKPDREIIGVCPRCGKNVVEYPKSFSCESGRDGCGFTLWKENRFFTAKKKTLTKQIAAALLKTGRVKLTGCYSEKTGKTYDAMVILEDADGKTNFGLEFLESKTGSKTEKKG